jgi:hypothetical protein
MDASFQSEHLAMFHEIDIDLRCNKEATISEFDTFPSVMHCELWCHSKHFSIPSKRYNLRVPIGSFARRSFKKQELHDLSNITSETDGWCCYRRWHVIELLSVNLGSKFVGLQLLMYMYVFQHEAEIKILFISPFSTDPPKLPRPKKFYWPIWKKYILFFIPEITGSKYFVIFLLLF